MKTRHIVLLQLLLICVLLITAAFGIGCKQNHSSNSGQCSPGCPYNLIGNGICSNSCNNAACGYDGGDCSAPTPAYTDAAANILTPTPEVVTPLVDGGIVCNGVYYKGINIACYDNKFYEAYQLQLCDNDSECPSDAPKCFKHECCLNLPYYYLKVDIEAPVSVPINTDFTVEVTLENAHPSEKVDLIIDRLLFYRFIQYPLVNFTGGGSLPYSDSRNPEETSFSIEPGEIKNFEFIFNSQDSLSFNAGIHLWIHEPGYGGLVQSQPIIVYDPSQPCATCGDITFNTQYATCVENVLYIAGAHKCDSDVDCNPGSCYQYYCVNPLSTALTTKPTGNYSAGLLVLYLSDDSNERKEQEESLDLQKTVNEANDWFQEEISYWNVTDFNITYEKLDCPGMTHDSFLDIAENNVGEGALALYEDVAQYCGIDREKYQILGINWEFGQDQDSLQLVDALQSAGVYFGASGVYYGDGIFTAAMFGYTFPVHETMHAFGLSDLYLSQYENYVGDAGSEYIWRDCYLMSAKAMKIFSPFAPEHITLCELEAFQLGWTE